MITVDALSFGYTPSSPILQGVGARFEEGTTTALVGRSGSGKSTLLYLLGLMLTPTSGEIRIGDVDTSDLADAARADLRGRHMGFVFQDALLDPARSVLDNVLEGGLYNDTIGTERSEWEKRARRLLSDFGVDADPGRRPGQLSGGQAQRVALCRAFLTSPSIILADEPTGNLDDETAAIVWTALRDRARDGAVVIVATHDRVRASTLDELIEVHRVAVG